MKVLTIVSDLGHRGTQRAAQAYTLGLQRRGVDVALLALDEGGVREQILRGQSVPVFIGNPNMDKAISECRKFNADIIQMHRPGLPCQREGDVLRALKTPRSKVLETNVFGRLDWTRDNRLFDVHLHIAVWNLHRWRHWARGRDAAPAVVVPYPIDTRTFTETTSLAQRVLRHRYDTPADAFVCGRIGKWHPMVFAVFKEFARTHGDAYLWSVEDSREVADAVEALPSSLQRRVRRIPVMHDDRDLAGFYSAITCLLHGVRMGESFGMVLAEAMSCGTPVVTAATPHKDNAQCEVVGPHGGRIAGSLRRLGSTLDHFSSALKAGTSPTREQVRAGIVDKYDEARVIDQLISVAECALTGKSRSSLRHALATHPRLITDITQAEIRSLSQMCDQPFAWQEVLQMGLIRVPAIYRAYTSARLGWRKRCASA